MASAGVEGRQPDSAEPQTRGRSASKRRRETTPASVASMETCTDGEPAAPRPSREEAAKAFAATFVTGQTAISSNATTMEQMFLCLSAALENFDVVKNKDLDTIFERLNIQDHRLEAVEGRTNRVEERTEELEEQVRQMRTELQRLSETQEQLDKSGQLGPTWAQVAGSAGSAASSTMPSDGSTGSPGLSQQWLPRFVAIRGFAPYGCDHTSKLTEDECNLYAKKAYAFLPQTYRAKLKVAKAFQVNYQIVFPLAAPTSESGARAIANFFEEQLRVAAFDIKGKHIRVVAELAPERRAHYRNFVLALEILDAKLDDAKTKVLGCRKALCIHRRDTMAELGRSPKGGTAWVWNKVQVEELGLAVEDLKF